MYNHRFVGCRLYLVFLFSVVPGCQVFQATPTLTVLVRDAETKKPIPTSEVYLCQRLKGDEVAPCRSKGGFTQADGIARLRAEPPGENGLQVQAVAQGYLPDKANVDAEVIKNKETAAASAKKAKQAADAVVELYAEPAFSVELVLPPGYRGAVKVRMLISEKLPVPLGQRCFRFPVSPSGDVQVHGPPLLRRVPIADFRARYGNGPLLASTLEVEKVGFHWLKGGGDEHFFVAGTQLDYEVLHTKLDPNGAYAQADPKGGRHHKYRYGQITAKNYEK